MADEPGTTFQARKKESQNPEDMLKECKSQKDKGISLKGLPDQLNKIMTLESHTDINNLLEKNCKLYNASNGVISQVPVAHA